LGSRVVWVQMVMVVATVPGWPESGKQAAWVLLLDHGKSVF